MKPPTLAMEDVQRILADQDAKVRRAYEALDPGQPIAVSAERLRELAERSNGPKNDGVGTLSLLHAVRG